MNKTLPTIVVLGASGLIGEAVSSRLRHDDFPVVAVARRFTHAQKARFGRVAIERPIVELSSGELARLLSEVNADVVLNCVGVLQDRDRGRTDEVHRGFVTRLIEALAQQDQATLLLHVSIPGRDIEDRTPFSLTKRESERVIVAGPVPFVILRPGFVMAPAAYGGSALVRALAALPVELPKREAGTSFAVTDVADIALTVAIVSRRWLDGERSWAVVWEVMERHPSTVGEVVNAFRQHFGGPTKRLPLPSWLLDVGAKAGDLAARLGWAPPIRSTALQEMRSGVQGNPESWVSATAIEPAPLKHIVQRLPATVQEKWFARLYLAKPLVLGVLVVFWSVSGLIALTAAFAAATTILTSHGVPLRLAQAITIASSLIDITVGLAIAFRQTCRAGLLAGIGFSLFYLAGAAMITPDLWVEPLGALVKTGPAIVLMLVALAILEDR